MDEYKRCEYSFKCLIYRDSAQEQALEGVRDAAEVKVNLDSTGVLGSFMRANQLCSSH